MSEEQIEQEFQDRKEKQQGLFHIHFTDIGLNYYISLLRHCQTTDKFVEDLWLPDRLIAAYGLHKRANCSYCSELFKEKYYGRNKE